MRVWEGQKRDFEAAVGELMKSSIDSACSEFEARGALLFASPSNHTDFVGAVLTCQRFFEKQDYDKQQIVIYSDMIEMPRWWTIPSCRFPTSRWWPVLSPDRTMSLRRELINTSKGWRRIGEPD